MKKQLNSSWDDAARWYDRAVGEKGHYYHEHVIFPKLLKLMDLKPESRVVDLGCGQGILARQIPPAIPYLGIDLSQSLIHSAKTRTKEKNRQFLGADLGKPLKIKTEQSFTHATLILALQNIENTQVVLDNAANLLTPGGRLFIVLNHPCFRIPRQTSWGIDEQKQIQYRRVDRYLSSLKIPIQTHPGQKNSDAETWSFHHSLTTYSQSLNKAGFMIEKIEEWCSDKKSTGSKAKMEDFSREEFPLFMLIVAYRGVDSLRSLSS